MTVPLDPDLDPHEVKSSPVDSTIDPAPAAPGPLFVDQGGELKTAPVADHLERATNQTPPVTDSATATATPAPTQPAPATSRPLSMQKAPASGPDAPAFGPTSPAPGPAAPSPGPTAPSPGPTAAPWTGGRSPFADGSGPVAADSDSDTTYLAQVPVRPFVALAERPQAVLGSGPAAVFPVPNEPTRAAMGTDVVTCPECGQLATVDMARRQADDFCRSCDFPLFWARGTVIAPEGAESGASLRRLPGTVGRAATAALICPHCSEPNSPAAEICVRCALSLHPVEIPEPEPVVIAPPEPEPEPEPLPEKSFDWWWIVAIAAALVAIALLVGLLYLR